MIAGAPPCRSVPWWHPDDIDDTEIAEEHAGETQPWAARAPGEAFCSLDRLRLPASGPFG
jgi:hypothetical protein